MAVIAEATLEKRQFEAEEKLTLVWLGEHYHRLKRLPPLKEVLKSISAERKMSNEEMLNMVKKLNAQFGGTVERGGE